jgi:intergrase/recombinase
MIPTKEFTMGTFVEEMIQKLTISDKKIFDEMVKKGYSGIVIQKFLYDKMQEYELQDKIKKDE